MSNFQIATVSLSLWVPIMYFGPGLSSKSSAIEAIVDLRRHKTMHEQDAERFKANDYCSNGHRLSAEWCENEITKLNTYINKWWFIRLIQGMPLPDWTDQIRYAYENNNVSSDIQ